MQRTQYLTCLRRDILLSVVALAVLGLMAAGGASAQRIAPGAIDPGEGTHLPLQFFVSQVGNKQCVLITFEGGGDVHQLQATAGATFSSNAFTLIDSDAGGEGDFANEPSPDTIVIWQEGGDKIQITFDQAMSDVSFFYGSAVPVTFNAFDATMTLVGSVSGPGDASVDPVTGGPCTGDPTGSFFCNFSTELRIELAQNRITNVDFVGAPDASGIDNLFFCRTDPVLLLDDSVDDHQEIVDNNPGTPLAEALEDAVAKLQEASDELAKTPPDDESAVGSIEGAVADDEAAVDEGLLDPTVGTQLMDQPTEAARQLAVDAINEAIAQGGDPDKIAEAKQALADADALRASGKFKKAVNKYKDSLKSAERG